MKYINIISKEQIMEIPLWQGFIILVMCFAIMFGFIVYGYRKRKNKTCGWIFVMTISTIIFELTSLGICHKYFSVPSGRYRYEATISKDEITVQEYEDFIEEYNPTVKDGIYYWESEEIIYEENRAI